MEEVWKDIKGYEGKYQVSNLGQVKSLDVIIEYTNKYGNKSKQLHKGKIISQHDNGYGYMSVMLWKDNKSKNFYIHRLVAEAFIPNPYNLSQVNHIDENKQNNSIDNLEWCDVKYNNNYGTKNKRSVETLLNNGKNSYYVKQYSVEGVYINQYRSLREAERENNLSNGSISAYFRYNQSQCGGYCWEII